MRRWVKVSHLVGATKVTVNLRNGVNQYGRDLEARVGVWRARFRGEA